MLTFLGLIIICALLALSAFWSGSETALTTLSKYRVKKLIVTNKALSSSLGEWLKSPYYILTTILVGNTLNNLALSSIATIVMLAAFKTVPQELIELITWLLLTSAILIFGEITPKVFSRSNPEKVTLFAMPLLSRVIKLTKPLSWPAAKIQKAFPKLNLFPVSKLAFLGLEEMRGLIAESDSAGALGKETSQMLDRVLNMGDLDVRKIMTMMDKVEAVDIDQEESKFLDKLVETGRSRVPVYHGTPNKMAGFVHTKDLLWVWKRSGGKFTSDFVHPPYFISPDKRVYDLMKEFQSGQTHMAFVKDTFGNLLGIITLEDILERIVGDILDEYDVKKKKK
ncbi:MAG: hemolysin family protein [Elusimicrobiota bacterium]